MLLLLFRMILDCTTQLEDVECPQYVSCRCSSAKRAVVRCDRSLRDKQKDTYEYNARHLGTYRRRFLFRKSAILGFSVYFLVPLSTKWKPLSFSERSSKHVRPRILLRAYLLERMHSSLTNNASACNGHWKRVLFPEVTFISSVGHPPKNHPEHRC